MGFRDDGEAARARADAVERENRELRQRLAGLEQTRSSEAAAPTRAPGIGGRAMLYVVGGLAAAVAGVVLVVGFGAPLPLLPVCVAAGMFIVCMGVVSSLLYVASPNELLVLSGRRRRLSDGRVVGYRVIRGRAVRMPFLERVDRLDLTNIALAIGLQGAYSEGGARVSLGATANVKLAADEPALHNAVERFLGHSRSEIASVARETIEGAIRYVVADLAVKELQSDREKAAQRIAEEAEHNLSKLGIVLDTLQLDRVEPDDQVP